MILFTVLSHHDVHVKAQLRDKGILVLYYEVGNSTTFPYVDPEKGFYSQFSVSKSLSLYETKVKVISQAKISRKITNQPNELERLAKRIGFSKQEISKLINGNEITDLFADKQNLSRPELLQYRMLRALL